MFEKILNWFLGTDKKYRDERIPQIVNGNYFDISKAEAISTVFTCVNILANTVSKLPLEVYRFDTDSGKLKDKTDYRYPILHYNPNNYTTSQAFISTLEVLRNLTGNAFARIWRNAGKVKSLEIIHPNKIIDYQVINGELYYILKINKDKDDVVPASEMLHFKMISKDGIWGLNPIQALRLNLSTTYKGLSTIDNFYDNNANTPKALKSTVSGANQKAMLEALDKFNKEYTGVANAGKMIPLPPNTEIQEMSLNYEDAQFIQTIKFNANQIAALFGVPTHMVGNTETSKYNNVEQMAIGFKADTISPIARMYRQEFEMKLLTDAERIAGKSIEFNLNAMIETDHKTRMEGYRVLSQIGAISPNKIAQIENLPTVPEGDVRIVPMNMMNLQKISENENK